jgi:hypothetical protein
VADAHLVVLGETLDVRCGEENCDVRAVYRVRSAQTVRTSFEFVLPAGVTVTARVGAAAPPIDATPCPERAQFNALRSWRGRQLFAARFEGEVAAGTGEIVVTYAQPLSALEHDYGYFSTGRMTREFQYELAPLKEWALAPDFALAFTMTVPREPPGWWKRTFGHPRSLECGDGTGHTVAGALTQEAHTLRFAHTAHGRGFVDHLSCAFDDEQRGQWGSSARYAPRTEPLPAPSPPPSACPPPAQ